MHEIVSELNALHEQAENLSSLVSLGIIDDSGSKNACMVIKTQIRKKKEQFVLSQHVGASGKRLAITEVTMKKHGKEVPYYQTRIPWKGMHSTMVKRSYDELIDALFDHYSSDHRPKEYSVMDVYEMYIADKEKKGLNSSLTIVHNKADFQRYWAGRTLSEQERNDGKIQFERSYILDMPIKKVKASDIRSHYEYLSGTGEMSKKAFYNARSVMVGIFSYAYTRDISCIDVSMVSTRGLVFKEEEDHSEEVFLPEQREVLLKHLGSLPKKNTYSLAIQLMFCLCCRIGELRALKYKDISWNSDHSSAYIWLRHQIVDKKTDMVNRRATDVNYMKAHSSAGKRKFPLSEYALQIIRELQELHPESEYICSSIKGTPITTNRFNESLKKYCDAAGVPYYSSHKIRFYAVSTMYDKGVNETTIQRLAGHSNISTTRHYNRKIREYDLESDVLETGFGLSAV